MERIRRRFGSDLADIVESCSDTDVEPKPAWRQRKEEYLQHLAQASRSAKLVSAADKLHNATAILRDYRTFGEAIWSRFKGGMKGTLWNYRALVQAYGTMENQAIVRDLDRVVTELEAACEHLRSESLEMKSKITPTSGYVPQLQKLSEEEKPAFLYSFEADLKSPGSAADQAHPGTK